MRACVAHACMRALRRVASCCVLLRRAASRFYAAFLSYNNFYTAFLRCKVSLHCVLRNVAVYTVFCAAISRSSVMVT